MNISLKRPHPLKTNLKKKMNLGEKRTAKAAQKIEKKDNQKGQMYRKEWNQTQFTNPIIYQQISGSSWPRDQEVWGLITDTGHG